MKKNLIIQILLLSIFLAGCTSTEYFEFENTQFKIESANVNFTATGGIGEIVVAESENFTATVDKDWCSLEVNGKIISVTATPNMSISGRTAQITLTSGNRVNYVSVTQTSITFNIDANNSNINGRGGEVRIAYQTEASLAVDTVIGSWLTASVDGNEIILQATANPNLDSTRSANVILAIQNGSTTLFTYNINVTQEKNYLDYEDYIGTYTMHYTTTNASSVSTRSLSVKLSVKSATDKTYYLEGILTDAMSQYGNITVKYNADGTLSILGQIMFIYPGATFNTWFIPFSLPSADGTYYNLSTTCGMVSNGINRSNGGLKFKMVDNGVWNRVTAGFNIRVFDGSTSKGVINGTDGQSYYYFPSFEKQ
jgi:hypothetical protein